MGRGDTQNMLSAGSLLPVPCAHSLSSASQAWTINNPQRLGVWRDPKTAHEKYATYFMTE